MWGGDGLLSTKPCQNQRNNHLCTVFRWCVLPTGLRAPEVPERVPKTENCSRQIRTLGLGFRILDGQHSRALLHNLLGLHWGSTGIMEKKMETTI